MIYWITWIFSRLVSFFIFPFKVYGKEHIPTKGNFIIACNHLSNLDPIIIPLIFSRKMSFMAKDSLFRIFFLGSYLKKLHAFPINRESSDIGAVKETLKRLKKGEPVLIFPQGTRASEGIKHSVQPGVGFVAAKTGLPVIPIYIQGSDSVMPPRKKIPRRNPVRVFLGKPLLYARRREYQEIADNIMSSIQALPY